MAFRVPRSFVAAAVLLSLAGCEQFGAAAGLVAQAIPRNVDAAYKGLAGQQTIVMVWADRGVRLDNPLLQEDVGAAVQNKLIQVQKDQDPEALRKTTFPVSTAVVARYQDDHPELEFERATDVAAKFTGSRLIYIEVTEFNTRSDASLELYRGTMSAHLSVIEMTDGPDGKVQTKTAYDGGVISVSYPKNTPQDGLPIGNDSKIAQGTVDKFADEVAKRFYLHEEDRD